MSVNGDIDVLLTAPLVELLFAAVERWRQTSIPRDEIGLAIVLGAAVGAIEILSSDLSDLPPNE
jgi:hypothetical protein